MAKLVYGELSSDLAGQLVILSGPSGVGKTVLAERLVACGVCVRAITATTRQPRDGEQHGVHYLFLERSEFEQGLEQGQFLEHAEVHENLYGTPLAPLAEQLGQGQIVLLLIDVQGVEQLMDRQVPATYVFIEAPSWGELERRLRGRGSENDEATRVRLENARKEMAVRHRYEHCVVNDDLENTVTELRELLGA